MLTKIKTSVHYETLCPECARMLDAGGISRQVPEWGEDVITPDMVRERAPAPHATRCTWCGPESRWLSERLIARLPHQDRKRLEFRLRVRIRRAERGCNAKGKRLPGAPIAPTPHYTRLLAMLGRLSALTA